MAGGCDERVFDRENYQENLSVWSQYGSELAGDFGTKPCGRPVVWGGKCEEHKVERRKGGRGRRKGDQEPQGPLVSPAWSREGTSAGACTATSRRRSGTTAPCTAQSAGATSP